MAKKGKYYDIAKILAILGGLIALIEAILSIAGRALVASFGIVSPLIGGIVALILALAVLFSALKPDDPIPFNGVVVLILGILVLIFGSLIGGILVIIAGILLIV